MQEVVMLVDNLLRSEETTIGMIVDCLYDIGSVRLIDQKVEPQVLQDLTKPIARLSKPAFRMIALRWLKKNCPVLLANWLYSKVKFDKAKPAPKPKTLREEVKKELDENIAAPIADNPLNPKAAIEPETPFSSTPYPPHAAPPLDALKTVDTDAAKGLTASASTSQALVPVASDATAVAPPTPFDTTSSHASDTGIVPLSEYNRAIAQIKYRDQELLRLRAQVRICMALVVGSAIAMGGLLLAVNPETELGQPTPIENQLVEE